MKQSVVNRPMIVDANPRSPISESFRTLRTNIHYSSVDDDVRVLMITSAKPGEGKSTTASNLAVAYAQADKRVLIMDADLRKPTLHHIFDRSNFMGLTSVLAGGSPLSEVVKETHVRNLDVITSGPLPPNPSEMLASKRFETVLDELKALYDFIVIDTPPALAVTDAHVTASRCDGVLLVVNAGKVKRAAAIKLKESFDRLKVRILGVVLNNKNRKDAEAYYYSYYGG